jgi:Zn-dependent protease
MFGFFGVYWAAFGWPLALGLVVSIYIHEMGHVAALLRLGIKPSAPMFVPGLGAFVAYSKRVSDPREDAYVGLAGPIWGAGAGVAAFAAAKWTGSATWMAIAELTGFINLFNLIPFFGLDGSHGIQGAEPRRSGLAVAAAFACGVAGVGGFPLMIVPPARGRVPAHVPARATGRGRRADAGELPRADRGPDLAGRARDGLAPVARPDRQHEPRRMGRVMADGDARPLRRAALVRSVRPRLQVEREVWQERAHDLCTRMPMTRGWNSLAVIRLAEAELVGASRLEQLAAPLGLAVRGALQFEPRRHQVVRRAVGRDIEQLHVDVHVGRVGLEVEFRDGDATDHLERPGQRRRLEGEEVVAARRARGSRAHRRRAS